METVLASVGFSVETNTGCELQHNYQAENSLDWSVLHLQIIIAGNITHHNLQQSAGKKMPFTWEISYYEIWFWYFW